LYGIAEAGVHWFETYQRHHKEKLQMSTSAFDPCLLVTTEENEDDVTRSFGIVGMQTDDTLIVGSSQFLTLEDSELKKANFKAKPRETLTPGTTTDFNGGRLHVEEDNVIMVQKGQAEKLSTVKDNDDDRAQQYVEQRARGAYIASICQPEASFDYSVAAQVQEPMDDDYKKLNSRINWQIDHKDRGLRFIPINLATAKVMVFTDGSFANNKDLSSQIGFVIALVNESQADNSFKINGNLLHWSSTKCKRVTRSVLASEIYGMVAGFDTAFVLTATLETVMKRLGLPRLPLVVCTDSYSLYECLVKLGSTTEKRLMVDLMGLRESYERREIDEIRWINGADNPADAMTKSLPNRALERIVSDNRFTIRLEGWVQR
jgi:hypothetical protein